MFSRNTSTNVSTGIARSDSMVSLVGTSGSLFDGVVPVGSYSCNSPNEELGDKILLKSEESNVINYSVRKQLTIYLC